MTGVVCVLGCRPGSAALARRARVARDVFVARGARLVVACGGRDWNGRVEADELARMLEDGGVPRDAILRERVSRDTFENAVEAARLLTERGLREVVVVTCSWHLPRAKKLFERAGLGVVDGVGAPPPHATLIARGWWTARERVSLWKDSLR
ncbi:MAG: YdcF family protein [Labilithrix sp.]|nr:YdcF family protein [Labilithrix sp.]